MWKKIVRASKGEERLVVAFWLYAILIGAGLSAVLEVLSSAGAKAGIPFFGAILVFLSTAIAVAYFVWSSVVVWRCAYNVKRTYWGHAARVFTVLVTSTLIYELAFE